MIKLSNKIISSVIGVVVAAGAITATAAVAQPKVVSPTVAVNSKSPSSITSVSSVATVSSKTEVSKVADGVKEIQQATDNGVSKIHAETDKAVSQIQEQQNEDGKKALASVVYPIIDPETGRDPVYSNDKDYARCKAELEKFGDDAAKVPTSQSKACQAALAALKAKASTQAPTK